MTTSPTFIHQSFALSLLSLTSSTTPELLPQTDYLTDLTYLLAAFILFFFSCFIRLLIFIRA